MITFPNWSKINKTMANGFQRTGDAVSYSGKQFRKEYRLAKMNVSRKVHGTNADGNGKKIKLHAGRFIEACYLPGTADLCIDMSVTRWCQECPMFTTAVNLLQCSLCSSTKFFANDLCDSDFVASSLESQNIAVIGFGGAPDPVRLVRWIKDVFVSTGGEYSINVASQTRKAAMEATDMKTQILTLRRCREEIAGMWCRDMYGSFKSQEAYLSNIWSFDAKFQSSGHFSDIGQRVEDAVNKQLKINS